MTTKKISSLIKKLATTDTGNSLFNPYNQFNKTFDDRTAPGVRQQNLRIYLNSHFKKKSKTLLVYLTPTYLEARRSGIPMANTSTFKQVEEMLSTEKSFMKATRSKKVPNNTMLSSSLLDIFDELNVNPLVWPLIPFYAHKKGATTEKRKPTSDEIEQYKVFLDKIIEIYEPKHILALGKGTKAALDELKIKSKLIPHPRRGKDNFKKAILKYS